VEFANGTEVNLSTFIVPDGRYEQFLVEPAEYALCGTGRRMQAVTARPRSGLVQPD
jgi:hypothetical protein